MNYLRKMYKYSLQMFFSISTNPKLLQENSDCFIFNSKIFERVDRDGREIRMDQRQLYMLFEENLPIGLCILKNFDRFDDGYAKVGFVHSDVPYLLRLLLWN